MISFGHAPDETSDIWRGSFATREAAVQAGRAIYGRTHSFYIVEGKSLRIEDFVPPGTRLADAVLEEIWMNAYEKYGDHADVFPEIDEVGIAARDELYAFVKSWVQRRLRNGWVPTGKPVLIAPATQLALVPNRPSVQSYRTAGHLKT